MTAGVLGISFVLISIVLSVLTALLSKWLFSWLFAVLMAVLISAFLTFLVLIVFSSLIGCFPVESIGLLLSYVMILTVVSVSVADWSTIALTSLDSLVFVAVLLLFEFILVFIGPYLDNLTSQVPVYILLLNIAIAFLLLPINNYFENFIKKHLYKKTTPPKNEEVSDV